MYERVIFYNHYGAGDVFESREFVFEWKEIVPARLYEYSHGKNPRILKDIPWLHYKEPTAHMNAMRGIWDDGHGNLYVNTWIGRDGSYVLPGIGCTVEGLYRMHNDLLKVYNLGKLSGEPKDYIPQISYQVYNIASLTDLMSNISSRKIFIDNGLVQSMQAKNFDFNSIIEALASNHKDKVFFVTQPYYTEQNNVIAITHYTGATGFDLNEVSYVSLFCDTLIGRNSGPHVYTQVKENVFNDSKKLLSFTYHQQGSSFVVNTDVLIQKFWSAATHKSDVIRKIEEVISL